MLPRFCYTSPAFFEFEREAVFARNWVCVGRTDQIAAAGRLLFRLGGRRAGDRRPQRCRRHPRDGRGVPASRPCAELRRQQSRDGLLRCPLHYWTYDLEGRLVGAPRMGDALARLRDTVRLPPVRIELWHGFIFVNLDGTAPPAGAEPRQGRAVLGGLRRSRPGHRAAGCRDDAAAVELEDPARELHRRLPPRIRASRDPRFRAEHPSRRRRRRSPPMADGDNAIIRNVPMLTPDGGMMRDGWGAEAMLPGYRDAVAAGSAAG